MAPDIRFQNELYLIKKHSGFVIKVNRPSQINNDQHISETSINAITGHDILIRNDSTIDALYNKIRDLFTFGKHCHNVNSLQFKT